MAGRSCSDFHETAAKFYSFLFPIQKYILAFCSCKVNSSPQLLVHLITLYLNREVLLQGVTWEEAYGTIGSALVQRRSPRKPSLYWVSWNASLDVKNGLRVLFDLFESHEPIKRYDNNTPCNHLLALKTEPMMVACLWKRIQRGWFTLVIKIMLLFVYAYGLLKFLVTTWRLSAMLVNKRFTNCRRPGVTR